MFKPYSHDNGLQPWEYVSVTAGTYKAGQLLKNVGGLVMPIGAASKTTPSYLCMADVTVAADQEVPVIRVTDKMVFETTLSAEAAGIGLGVLLEVSTGGLEVDAAAEGTFEVSYYEGTEAGSVVRGRFK